MTSLLFFFISFYFLLFPFCFFFFFFNDTATTEIYTLSLHDALPISSSSIHGAHYLRGFRRQIHRGLRIAFREISDDVDRKSTRLNSSHDQISYAVFCLKKKKKKLRETVV